ncbi:cupin domain-containing protein [Methyloceanibacter sp.]|uniref:cupin domain-containing protein n=1 Tax=Methyloceanibacter sp. TaxID=1965321 RepID=UPI003D9B9281
MCTVSEREFPISATMSGALLTIKPGALRELHWHPHAAEWQFYLKGSARMTVFGSHSRARTDEFAAHDVGYVPQATGITSRTPATTTWRSCSCSTTAPTSPCRLPPGLPPIPTFCSARISRCRKACSPNSRKTLW